MTERRTTHEEVAALLGGDMEKAKQVITLISIRIAAEAERIADGNAPALREFGGEWCIREARFRELAALFMRQWSHTLDLDLTLMEIKERRAKADVLYKRVDKLLKEALLDE